MATTTSPRSPCTSTLSRSNEGKAGSFALTPLAATTSTKTIYASSCHPLYREDTFERLGKLHELGRVHILTPRRHRGRAKARPTAPTHLPRPHHARWWLARQQTSRQLPDRPPRRSWADMCPGHRRNIFIRCSRTRNGFNEVSRKQHCLQQADAVQQLATACLYVTRSTGRSLPDGQLIVRPPAAQGESSNPVSRVFNGCTKETWMCTAPEQIRVASLLAGVISLSGLGQARQAVTSPID
eukprot:4689506-Pleurochrysis_carterae.AAC.3